MVSIPPARELTDLEAIALLSGLAAGATALPNESLNQELVAPDSSASLGGIKKAGDVCERLGLVHAIKNSWEPFG